MEDGQGGRGDEDEGELICTVVNISARVPKFGLRSAIVLLPCASNLFMFLAVSNILSDPSCDVYILQLLDKLIY